MLDDISKVPGGTKIGTKQLKIGPEELAVIGLLIAASTIILLLFFRVIPLF